MGRPGGRLRGARAAGVRVPVGHPRLDGRDADPERRRLRAGGLRDGRVRAGARPGERPDRGAAGRASAGSPTARAASSTATATSCSRSRSRCARTTARGRCATPSSRGALDVPVGGTAPLAEVREAVLELRRGKGMVIDPADPDSVSAGSFFTNPILDPDDFARLEERRRPDRPARLPRARRADQDLGGVADRARRLPARLRRAGGRGSPPSTRSRSSTAAAPRRPS